jgi:hypothetical protein
MQPRVGLLLGANASPFQVLPVKNQAPHIVRDYRHHQHCTEELRTLVHDDGASVDGLTANLQVLPTGLALQLGSLAPFSARISNLRHDLAAHASACVAFPTSQCAAYMEQRQRSCRGSMHIASHVQSIQRCDNSAANARVRC